ncbi:MAG TPA: PRC-barrel domain-containing protein [Azospirillaceae bacterium]|nr:PRC-barrel domain-containing protein [Azospirillaceae bacterium]
MRWMTVAVVLGSVLSPPVAAQQAGDGGSTLPNINTDQPPNQDVQGRSLARQRLGAEIERLIGAKAVTSTGQEVGEIDNLLVAPDGGVRAVVVEWGSALGIDPRRTAVPADRVEVAPDGSRAVLAMTREQLESAPTWDPDVPAASGIDPDIKPLRGRSY